MSLFLVGSGPCATIENVHDEFVELARERGTRVAVALLGSEESAGDDLEAYAEPIRRRWSEVEIVPIWLDDEPNPADNSTVWPDDLTTLAGLVVGDGWTPGYLTALMPQRATIARLVRQGAPYMGFSAGAMVVAKHALVGGHRLRGRQVAPEVWSEGLDEIELRDGLGLIGPVVDVHTDQVGLDRMLAVLERGQVASGVAIDEGTCLVVDAGSGRTRIEGDQRVHWLGREAGATTVRHESSPAERARIEAFLATEKAEAERLAAEQAEAERLEAERLAAEQAATPSVEPAPEATSEDTTEDTPEATSEQE